RPPVQERPARLRAPAEPAGGAQAAALRGLIEAREHTPGIVEQQLDERGCPAAPGSAGQRLPPRGRAGARLSRDGARSSRHGALVLLYSRPIFFLAPAS